MSRPATAEEWLEGTRCAAAWLAQEQAALPRRFDGARIDIQPDALVVQFADSEDLRVEREATIPIWSARAKSVASSRLLVGIMLCLQRASTAETFQLSSEKRGGWAAAARALTPVWGAVHELRTLTPTHITADTLIYVHADQNAQHVRAYFRAALELDAHALPDDAFTDTVLGESD